MQWLPPFGKDDVKVVYESPNRIQGVQYSEDCRWLFITQTVDGQRQITGIDLDDPKKTYVIHKATRAFEPKKDGDRHPGRRTMTMTRRSTTSSRAGFRGGAGAFAALGLMSRPLGGGVNVVRISRGRGLRDRQRPRAAARPRTHSPSPTSTPSTSRPARRPASSRARATARDDRRGGRRRRQARLHHPAEVERRARLLHDRPRHRQGNQADEQRGPRRRGSTS